MPGLYGWCTPPCTPDLTAPHTTAEAAGYLPGFGHSSPRGNSELSALGLLLAERGSEVTGGHPDEGRRCGVDAAPQRGAERARRDPLDLRHRISGRDAARAPGGVRERRRPVRRRRR